MGVMGKRRYDQHCSVARALDVVGERWTLLVVRELLTGPKRFKDLLEGLPGIGTNLLAARLKDLEGHGILQRATLPPPAGSKVYELTGVGLALEPVVMALSQWGLGFLGNPDGDDDLRPSWAMVAVRSRLDPGAVSEGVRESYEFRVTGEVFYVRVRDGKAEVRQGPASEPDLIFSGDAQAFLALASGQLEPADAIQSGSVRIEGDHNALARCLKMFRLSA
jgi:DNA-binding HxlR family transcriptional regulator